EAKIGSRLAGKAAAASGIAAWTSCRPKDGRLRTPRAARGRTKARTRAFIGQLPKRWLRAAHKRKTKDGSERGCVRGPALRSLMGTDEPEWSRSVGWTYFPVLQISLILLSLSAISGFLSPNFSNQPRRSSSSASACAIIELPHSLSLVAGLRPSLNPYF